jgi:purine nucleosidase
VTSSLLGVFALATVLLTVIPAHGQTATRANLWLDTDLACGNGPRRDVDDCVALAALAVQAPDRLVGLSLTYGNAGLNQVAATASRLSPQWQAQTGRALAVTLGAAGPGDCAQNAASEALVAASRRERLTVLAIGPLTNLACALALDSTLAHRLDKVVIVGGAVPGHVFHPAEGSPNAILGHGPIARDLNVQLDPKAAARVLGSGVAIMLTPYQTARQVSLRQADLDRLSRSGPLGAAVARDARTWLKTWRDLIGRDGFYPFDLLAVAAVLRPHSLRCTQAPVRVTADRAISGNRFGPRRLIVGPLPWSGDTAPTHEAQWCGDLNEGGDSSIRTLISP